MPVNLVDETTHAAGEAEAIKVGKLLSAMGAKYIVLADDNGTVPQLVAEAGRAKGSRLSPEQWDVVARGVNRIAQKGGDFIHQIFIYRGYLHGLGRTLHMHQHHRDIVLGGQDPHPGISVQCTYVIDDAGARF